MGYLARLLTSSCLVGRLWRRRREGRGVWQVQGCESAAGHCVQPPVQGFALQLVTPAPGVFGQNPGFRRGEHAVEPPQHRHGQHDALVLRGPVRAAQPVGDLPDQGRKKGVVGHLNRAGISGAPVNRALRPLATVDHTAALPGRGHLAGQPFEAPVTRTRASEVGRRRPVARAWLVSGRPHPGPNLDPTAGRFGRVGMPGKVVKRPLRSGGSHRAGRGAAVGRPARPTVRWYAPFASPRRAACTGGGTAAPGSRVRPYRPNE